MNSNERGSAQSVEDIPLLPPWLRRLKKPTLQDQISAPSYLIDKALISTCFLEDHSALESDVKNSLSHWERPTCNYFLAIQRMEMLPLPANTLSLSGAKCNVEFIVCQADLPSPASVLCQSLAAFYDYF